MRLNDSVLSKLFIIRDVFSPAEIFGTLTERSIYAASAHSSEQRSEICVFRFT